MLTQSRVYYEESKKEAEARLEKLRQENSTAIELKAYILRVGPKQFRVLRKIQILEVQKKSHDDILKEFCHHKKGL